MSQKHVVIINGPNLNLLGRREPDIYGQRDFDSFFEELKSKFQGVQLTYYQSNVEGELINKLHEYGFSVDGIVLNAGGYTHTSVALADAVASIKSPVIEVHISNIYSREEVRHTSLTARHCRAVIAGLGLFGYEAAIMNFLNQQKVEQPR